MLRFVSSKSMAAAAVALSLGCSAIAGTVTPTTNGSAGAGVDATTGARYTADAPGIRPVDNWAAPQYLDLPTGVTASPSMKLSAGSTMAKTTWTLSSFVPITPCRLVDTRGAFSPVYAGGPFAAGEVRNYVIPGNCGVPAGTSHVRGVSLQVTTPPTGASGDIEIIPTGATLGGTVAMVIQAGQWNSVSITPGVNAAGSIQVQLRSTPGDVVIDINGYYANVNTAQDDVFAVNGTHPGGGVLFVTNADASGSAINAINNGAGGGWVQLGFGSNAVDIVAGDIRVRGAGLNTGTAAFIHTVNTATDLCPNPVYAKLNNPVINLNPAAILLVTATGGGIGSTVSSGPTAEPVSLYYSTSCNPAGGWNIYTAGGFTNGAKYNVLVIKP